MARMTHTDLPYIGRFAPSPTGPLHFGSLVAALGSYLQARMNHGQWHLRMEDLDTPRCMPATADDILHPLERFGFEWDGAVVCQSQRLPAYRAALDQLQATGMVYGCACTRREIADSSLHGIEGAVYPGTCRRPARFHPATDIPAKFAALAHSILFTSACCTQRNGAKALQTDQRRSTEPAQSACGAVPGDGLC